MILHSRVVRTRPSGRHFRQVDAIPRPWWVFPTVVWALWRGAVAVGSAVTGGGLGGRPFAFDGGWFRSILADGYVVTDPTFSTQQNPAFLPGLVWLTEPLSWVLGDSTAAVVVSNATALSAFLTVFGAVQATAGDRAARRGIVALALWPASFVFGVYYSEGLFVTVTAAAVWAERRGRPPLAAAAMLAASLTRTIGVALGPVVAVARIARDRRIDATSTVYGLSGPLGLAVVAWAQERQTGIATAWMEAQRGWDRSFSAPWVPVHAAVEAVVDKFPSPAMELTLNLMAIGVVGGAMTLVTRAFVRRPHLWPLVVWGWTAWLLPLWSRVPSSQIRFALAVWPAALAVDLVPDSWRGRLVLAGSGAAGVMINLVLLRRWSSGAFIG